MSSISESFMLFLYSCIAIYVYGKIVSGPLQGYDPLKTVLIPCTDIDLWSVMHFGLYAILGYSFPDLSIYFAIIGAVWEAIEDITGDVEARRAVINGDIDPKGGSYWYAKYSDISVNIYGLIVGMMARDYNIL